MIGTTGGSVIGVRRRFIHRSGIGIGPGSTGSSFRTGTSNTSGNIGRFILDVLIGTTSASASASTITGSSSCCGRIVVIGTTTTTTTFTSTTAQSSTLGGGGGHSHSW